MPAKKRKLEWVQTYGRDEFRMALPSGAEVVLHHYIGFPDTLFVSCRALLIDAKRLRSNDVDKAKNEALKLVASRLHELRRDLDALEGM